MNEWNFQTDKIVHIPCGGHKAKRFHGTHGKIWCTRCSKPLPEDLEFVSDFMYKKEEIAPLEFYFKGSNFYLFGFDINFHPNSSPENQKEK